MSDEPKITLKKIRRHLEDHPNYYHEEGEIRYLVDLLEKEREAHEKAEKLIVAQKELIAKNQEIEETIAKQYVDMKTYAEHLEKKIADFNLLIRETDTIERFNMLREAFIKAHEKSLQAVPPSPPEPNPVHG